MYRTHFSLTDEVALVTGTRRGIGKTIALALSEAGAHVAVSLSHYSKIALISKYISAK